MKTRTKSLHHWFDRMPGLFQGSVEEHHDQTMTEALEQFLNSPEQNYEQFLTTFTYLTPENVRDPCLTVPGGHGDSSHREMYSSREGQRDGVTETEESAFQLEGQAKRCSLPADQEEVVLDSGCVGGRLGNAWRPGPGTPVKFDNYIGDLEEHGEDEEELADVTGTCALPGEVKEDKIPASSSSLCHHTLLEISSTFTDQRKHTLSAAENQNESNEVVAFHLDENFDYDQVVLSRKYQIQEQNCGSP
ncbi:intraflagellar transport-associated protein isoform X1 [Xyrauchen texanus]|uniref:intraflagellar transport-associated protein isoform X1 n=2 Tax=Xyrauchen texanus TaxID=154827 RepID=UPI002242C23E|nr:intraflagellar transport-associated protein isoform X1 [Xyrauchen texanus]